MRGRFEDNEDNKILISRVELSLMNWLVEAPTKSKSDEHENDAGNIYSLPSSFTEIVNSMWREVSSDSMIAKENKHIINYIERP